MFQMRRDGSEHLQQHYMLAVGLHAVEMLGIPLCGTQSHSVERRESIKDLGHMDTPKQHQQHTEREHFYLFMGSQGRVGSTADRQWLQNFT